MITPILLCGGSGTRLWPLSRRSYPKQFASLLGQESLFQASARRFEGPGFAPPLVITGEAFRFIVSEQLEAAGIRPGGILIEPEGRNTAAAAAAAALQLQAADPQALLLIVPSDHAVGDPAAFRASVERGRAAAEAGQIVTFGIRPTRPETGFGWLEWGRELDPAAQPGVHRMARFVEKPDEAQAEVLLADPRTLWNAGVFLARADALLAAYRAHAPAILEAVGAALVAAQADLGFCRLDAGLWAEVPEDSIDCAVMEKAQDVAVVPYDGHWSDLGGWQAVWQESRRDRQGNALSGQVTALDCEKSLLRSEEEGVALVGIGLKGVVAVAMRDAVLVADVSRAQQVKQAVAALKEAGGRQAEHFPVDHRPWGWFESLVLEPRFQVRRIHVRPGATLSLQSHHHRSEHWIVVEGTARVTVDGRVQLVSENQSVYIPLGAKHRLENPGKLPMVLIEVQTGAYLGEDDIIRHEGGP